jgi:hypothetical protein
VQNVHVNVEQLEQVMVAALAAASTKAQKRSLASRYGSSAKTPKRTLNDIGKAPAVEVASAAIQQAASLQQSQPKQLPLKSAWSYRSAILVAIALLVLVAAVFVISKRFKFSRRRIFFILLVVMSVAMHISVTMSQRPAKDPVIVEARPSAIYSKPPGFQAPTVAASSSATDSLYRQFVDHYSAIPGTHLFL